MPKINYEQKESTCGCLGQDVPREEKTNLRGGEDCEKGKIGIGSPETVADKTSQRKFGKSYEVVATGCWEWNGSKHESGYGLFHVHHKKFYAHRWSYICNVGPIPLGNVVRHKCDNRICVNPNHLITGTHGDNVMDAIERGRAWFQKYVLPKFCGNGHEFS